VFVTLVPMLVTGVTGADREEKLRQIDRIIASEVLHGSESLCKLLRYLAEHCIDHPGAGLKEYQIATELFGRPANFDPRIDATVRVQSGRLRSKLSEYYAHAGAADPWIIEVPKGAYSLNFSPRAPASPPIPEPAAAQISSSPATFPDARPRTPWYNPWQMAVVFLSIGLTLCLVALFPLLQDRANGRTAVRSDNEQAGGLALLWKDFVDTPEEPWVIFSNAEFVGRPETGMHYSSPADKGQAILDHYTGVGEVLGIHELDRVFASLHHGLRVKRGRLLSLDDAKNNDLIFVGSPSENLSLLEIPTAKDFVFRRMEDGARKGDLSIANVHARPGEGTLFLANEGLPITEDYAVIGLMPGLNPTRWIMLLAGITTIGTQAAVEYLSKPNTAEDLLKRINGSSSGKVAPFEAVLRVKVAHGVPVQSEVVALHLRN
jgi:hypothetical protein